VILPQQLLASFLWSLAVSLTCALLVLLLQGAFRRLRGCGWLLWIGLIVALVGLAGWLAQGEWL
jgi:hypothetical protein